MREYVSEVAGRLVACDESSNFRFLPLAIVSVGSVILEGVSVMDGIGKLSTVNRLNDTGTPIASEAW